MNRRQPGAYHSSSEYQAYSATTRLRDVSIDSEEEALEEFLA